MFLKYMYVCTMHSYSHNSDFMVSMIVHFSPITSILESSVNLGCKVVKAHPPEFIKIKKLGF